jgi:hypothetical protein
MHIRVLVALSVASALLGQIGGAGSIHGSISDQSGAVIPGVAVTATNTATGVQTTRQTTASGLYVLSPLSPGEYNVTASAQGFQTLVREKVLVDALSVVGLNLTLNVGAAAEKITVSDTAPQLATQDARLGQTMRNEEYSALPLAMGSGVPRNPLQFAFLQPGVTNTSRWGNSLGAQDFSNDVYVEGIAITNSVQQGEGRNLSLGVSVDAVDQFQTETAGTAVQFNGQGTQNYVIKSGTNSFHGSAFDYFRNTKLDARGFFTRVRPQQNQNEYGFTFGGPIRKNKLFFFGSYDGYEYRAGTAASFFSIPTMAARRGDFSALPVAIFDPATTVCNGGNCGRQAFPGNTIPASRISRVSNFFQQDLPATTNAALQNNYLGSVGVGYSNKNTTNKVDWSLNDKHQASFMFNTGKRGQATAYRGNTLPLPYATTRWVEEVPTMIQARHTWVLKPTLFSQLSLGFARLNVPIKNATIDGKWPQRAGLRGLPPGEADSSFPEVAFAGPNSPAGWRGTDARAFDEALNTFTLVDNVQWTRGKHALTFGFQHQRMQANEKERTYGSLAIFNFSNSQTAGFTAAGTLNAATGNSYASYLLGSLNGTTVIEDWVVGTGGRFGAYAWWAQDDFKVSPKLTLNLGLRYDLALPYVEVADRWSFFNPDLPNPAASGRPGALQFIGTGNNSCKCRTPIATYYGGWGPRVGLAYLLGSKTVIRSSYSIMYTRRGAVGGRGGARNGTGLLGYSAQPSFPSIDGFSEAYNWNAGLPPYQKAPFFDPTLNTGFTTTIPTGGSVNFGDPIIGGRPPRYQNWSFGLQRAFTNSTTVGASYVGSNGHNLGGGGRSIWSNQINPRYLALGNLLTARATAASIASARAIVGDVALPFANFSPNATIAQMLRPFPQYNGIGDLWGNVANSKYNALQVVLTQRKWSGLTLNWNYTYARVMDDTAGSRSAYNWKTEKAVALQDISHVLNGTFVYSMPFGKDGNPVVRHLARGWNLSGITQFSSGQPLGAIGAACNLPQAGGCYADYNRGFNGQVRINGDYGAGDLLGTAPPSFIDRNAFASPAAYTYGDTPRTLAHGLRGSHRVNQDLSIRRDFAIREGWKFSIQADAINALNLVYFGGIGTNITNANFGRVGSQSNSPRTVQLAARITF